MTASCRTTRPSCSAGRRPGRERFGRWRDRRIRLTAIPIEQRRIAMIKVSVMYPNVEGARFDHAYYRDKHMPLVKGLMGGGCLFYTVDKGLAGGAPGEPA